MAPIPSRVRRQRDAEIGQANSAPLVPVRIHCGNEVWIGLAHAGRQYRRNACLGLWSKVEPDRAGQMGWELYARDSREDRGCLLWGDCRAVGETRMPTWRWSFLGCYPPIQPHQGGTEQRRIIHTVEQMLAT